MKGFYNVIKDYRNQSGVHWDNEKGANIEGEAAATVWMSYIQQHKVCRSQSINCSVTNDIYFIV